MDLRVSCGAELRRSDHTSMIQNMASQQPDTVDTTARFSEVTWPSWFTRIVVVLAIWVVSGFMVHANYETDACPPEVKSREAMLAGFIAPLFFSANAGSAPLVHTVSLRPVSAWGYLILFVVLVFFVLRSRSHKALYLAGLGLGLLSAIGLWCVIYTNAHSGG